MEQLNWKLVYFLLSKSRISIHSFIIVVQPPPYIYVTHSIWALQSHDLSGEKINSGSHTYIFDHTRRWRASPDEWSAQCRGYLRDYTNIKDETHHPRTHYSNKAKMKGWLWRPNDIREPGGPKASWQLSYRWGKPRKNLTQETCPDWGSNSVPPRDRRACYRLFHSGGQKFTSNK